MGPTAPEAAPGAPEQRSSPPLAGLARGLRPPRILVAISRGRRRGPTPRRESPVPEVQTPTAHTLRASPRPESPHRFCGGGEFRSPSGLDVAQALLRASSAGGANEPPDLFRSHRHVHVA